jgi:hypothetical protein
VTSRGVNQELESLVGISHDWKADLLALVPVPLVDLAFAETQFLGDVAYEVSLPLCVLLELVCKDSQLVLVLTLATLDISS